MKKSPQTRFWEKVDRSGTCWLWTAATTRSGYGKFYLHGKYKAAHRLSYEWSVGPIPDAHQVDHRCHNPSCVNPEHLRVATQKQNQENRSGPRRDCRSGVRGVDRFKGRWRARVVHNKRYINIGYFDTIDEAAAAVKETRNRVFTYNDMDRAA